MAKRIAAEWVGENAHRIPGFCGAYFSGSLVGVADDEEWPATSDVDVMAIIKADPPRKLGKFLYGGVLLEVSFISAREFASLEHVLTTHYLAYALHADGVICDPEGWLAPLQREVARHFADVHWVRRRCEAHLSIIRQGVQSFDYLAPFHSQVTAWLFPTGIATFPILSAALQNCTVRKRYAAARGVLERYDRMDFYPRLMALLGCRAITADQLLEPLRELMATYDLACGTMGPSVDYPFRADVSPNARPIAIEGSRRLIESPHPQEAVFWMVATFARCHAILHMDAPDLHAERMPAFERFMAQLGIRADEDFVRRNRELLDFLPEILAVSEQIIKVRMAQP